MKLTATNLDFSSILQLDSIVNGLTPEVKQESLNAYLYYSSEKQDLSLFVKGSQSYANIGIPASVTTDATSDLSIMVYIDNIKHLINNYTDEQKSNLKMSIEYDEDKSTFQFESDIDNIKFAHLKLNDNEVKEIKTLISTLEEKDDEDEIFTFDNLDDSFKEYFMSGLNNCLSYIEEDLSNNAIAIYNDKFIANNKLHVYIYHLVNKLNLDTTPVSLHKKIAKTLLSLHGKKGDMKFSIYSGTMNKIKIEDTKFRFKAILNNNLANIAPPTEDDLKVREPSIKVFTAKSSKLMEIVKFFLGFYSSRVNYKTIVVKVIKSGMNFTLLDSGVVGYGSSHVERKFDVNVDTKAIGVKSMLIITSIQSFLSSLNKDDDVDFFMDEEHGAVVLRSNKQEIYLPRIS